MSSSSLSWWTILNLCFLPHGWFWSRVGISVGSFGDFATSFILVGVFALLLALLFPMFGISRLGPLFLSAGDFSPILISADVSTFLFASLFLTVGISRLGPLFLSAGDLFNFSFLSWYINFFVGVLIPQGWNISFYIYLGSCWSDAQYFCIIFIFIFFFPTSSSVPTTAVAFLLASLFVRVGISECSQDLHNLLLNFADEKVLNLSRSKGIHLGNDTKSLVIQQVRRRFSVCAIHAQSACLLSRLGHFSEGAHLGAQRRAHFRSREEVSRQELRSHFEAFVRGRRLKRAGLLHIWAFHQNHILVINIYVHSIKQYVIMKIQQ